MPESSPASVAGWVSSNPLSLVWAGVSKIPVIVENVFSPSGAVPIGGQGAAPGVFAAAAAGARAGAGLATSTISPGSQAGALAAGANANAGKVIDAAAQTVTDISAGAGRAINKVTSGLQIGVILLLAIVGLYIVATVKNIMPAARAT